MQVLDYNIAIVVARLTPRTRSHWWSSVPMNDDGPIAIVREHRAGAMLETICLGQ